jgi:hypothetical protein
MGWIVSLSLFAGSIAILSEPTDSGSAWFVLALMAFSFDGWEHGPAHDAFPPLFWQIILVSSSIALLAAPLRTRLREHDQVIAPTPLAPA